MCPELLDKLFNFLIFWARTLSWRADLLCISISTSSFADVYLVHLKNRSFIFENIWKCLALNVLVNSCLFMFQSIIINFWKIYFVYLYSIHIHTVFKFKYEILLQCFKCAISFNIHIYIHMHIQHYMDA